jgi:hypothetical protein
METIDVRSGARKVWSQKELLELTWAKMDRETK